MSEEKNETPGQEAPKPTEVNQEETSTFVLIYNKKNRTVNVRGAISEIADFYVAVEMAKDCVREWNRLNNGYLNATPVPSAPGKLNAAGEAFADQLEKGEYPKPKAWKNPFNPKKRM